MTTTVLYIGGTGRSGSTVLANLLGEAPGHVCVGEVRFLWERGITENRRCGCGMTFSECPFWQQVLRTAFPTGVPPAPEVAAALAERTRMRHLPRLGGTDQAGAELEQLLGRLYRAIAEVSGARVVVDSSKLPTYAALLRTVPDVDVRVVHLVRDPRAAAFSWRRVKALPDQGSRAFMERRGVVKSAGLWSVWNGALEWMWRRQPESYHRVAYERFVDSPEVELQAIVDNLRLDSVPGSAFTGPGSAQMSVHHTVAGNPGRFATGPVALRLDSEWVDSMPRRDRTTVEALTAPLMRRYGYRRLSQSVATS